MNGYVAVTDYDWFQFLNENQPWEEVNFWQPSGNQRFQAISQGELFFFKLKSPYNAIAGFGQFVHASILPAWLAWESFQEGNGADNYDQMIQQIHKYRQRHDSQDPNRQYDIGCLIISNPVFLDETNWVDVPASWSKNIVQGKTYDLTRGDGKKMYDQIKQTLKARDILSEDENQKILDSSDPEKRYGSPVEVKQRIGQQSFRIRVSDAYERACSVTREHSLPALDAAHIKPYSECGGHDVSNGILVRSDIHRLFDKGYVTVTPDYEFKVSGALKEKYKNGHTYYPMSDQDIWTPDSDQKKPDREKLEWHNHNKFLDN